MTFVGAWLKASLRFLVMRGKLKEVLAKVMTIRNYHGGHGWWRGDIT